MQSTCSPLSSQVDEYTDESVLLDQHSCDLNLIVDKECLLAYPMDSDGFYMMWAGCRATYGVDSMCGRVAFEVHVSDAM